jgi:diguanylate cyclase (GGDEF)-like protein
MSALDPPADLRATRRISIARLRAALPHGGSLPDAEWAQRHRVVLSLLWLTNALVPLYALAAHHAHAVSYAPEYVAQLAFTSLAAWVAESRKWRSLSASMGLLTAAATLVDISGGLTEMHFTFFVIIVVLTLYEDWVPFLLAVAFVLIHHGIMGEVDPRAVFQNRSEWTHPWEWAGIHAGFMALGGIAGVTAWGFNERVRDQMRATQRELECLGLTDSLTGLGNRRRLMADLERMLEGDEPAVLAIFDLDGFKEYNDRFGHPAGDSLLIRLTTRLRGSLRGSDVAYRLGGDEFCVLATDVAEGALEATLVHWTDCFTERGEGFDITASSGATLMPAEANEPSAALRLCDRRMYSAKHGRRTTAARQTRDVLLAALAARHTELGEHLSGVAVAAEQIAEEMHLSAAEIHELAYAAELHDVGKVAIPDTILAKPGPLDEEEWEYIRRHSLIGERILGAAPSLSTVAKIVRSTHERFDGTGYPDRLAGETIPLAARVVCVCDAYHAMTASRPYRRSRSHAEAVAELQRCSGTQFDPEVVRVFVALFAAAAPAERRVAQRPTLTVVPSKAA